MIQRNVEFSVSCLRDHGCRILVVSPKSLDPFPYSKNYAFSDHAWQSKVDIGQSFTDRKSTRLNSSHDQISYAVFCLKKKISFNVCFHFSSSRRYSSELSISFCIVYNRVNLIRPTIQRLCVSTLDIAIFGAPTTSTNH